MSCVPAGHGAGGPGCSAAVPWPCMLAPHSADIPGLGLPEHASLAASLNSEGSTCPLLKMNQVSFNPLAN